MIHITLTAIIESDLNQATCVPHLTLNLPITTAANNILTSFYFSEKIWLDISCESSARQAIHMNY